MKKEKNAEYTTIKEQSQNGTIYFMCSVKTTTSFEEQNLFVFQQEWNYREWYYRDNINNNNDNSVISVDSLFPFSPTHPCFAFVPKRERRKTVSV